MQAGNQSRDFWRCRRCLASLSAGEARSFNENVVDHYLAGWGRGLEGGGAAECYDTAQVHADREKCKQSYTKHICETITQLCPEL